MSDARYCIQDHRCVVSIGGEDRVSFLQGLVSNDVAKVTDGQAIWSAFLTPQGKFLHDFFMAGQGDSLLLSPEAARCDDLTKRLTLYKLRSKVSIERSGMAVAVLFGADALTALGLPDTPGAARAWGGGVVFTDPRLPAIGAVGFLPREALSERLAEAGFAAAAQEDYDAVRIALGLPDGSRDLEVEKTLLLEAGFDELHGVDWKKGCYMGQELTARTKYRGLVKRRLLPVVAEETLEEGAPVLQGEKEVGRIRSVAGGRALVELRVSALETAGEAPLMAGAASLRPALPAWLQLPAREGA